MKKYLLSFVLTILSVLTVSSQEQKDNADEIHPLVGVWQQAVVVQNPNNPEERVIRKTANFKFLNKDGTFSNMVLSDGRQISNITVYGMYEINSDKSYTELVEKSYTNSNDTGRKVKMDYELSNENKFLVISYFSIHPTTGEAMKGNEFWVRVEYGTPFVKRAANS